MSVTNTEKPQVSKWRSRTLFILVSEADMDYSKKTTQKKQKKLVSKHTKNKNKITYLLYKSFIFLLQVLVPDLAW